MKGYWNRSTRRRPSRTAGSARVIRPTSPHGGPRAASRKSSSRAPVRRSRRRRRVRHPGGSSRAGPRHRRQPHPPSSIPSSGPPSAPTSTPRIPPRSSPRDVQRQCLRRAVRRPARRRHHARAWTVDNGLRRHHEPQPPADHDSPKALRTPSQRASERTPLSFIVGGPVSGRLKNNSHRNPPSRKNALHYCRKSISRTGRDHSRFCRRAGQRMPDPSCTAGVQFPI